MNTTTPPVNNIIFTLDLSEKYLNMTYYENNVTDSNNTSNVPVNFDIEVDGKEFMTTIIDTLDTLNTTIHHITNETIDYFFTDLTEFQKNLAELAEFKEKFLIEENEVNGEDLNKFEFITEELDNKDIEVYDEVEHSEDHSEEHSEEHFDEHSEEHSNEHFDEHSDEHSDEHFDEHSDEHSEDEYAEGEHINEEHFEGDHSNEEHFEGEHIEEHFEGEHSEDEHFEGEHSEEEHFEEEHSEDEHSEEEHSEEEHSEGEHFEEEHSEEEHSEESSFTKLEYSSDININHPDFHIFNEEVSRLLNEKYSHLYDDIYLINQNQDIINHTDQKMVDNSPKFNDNTPIYPFIILIIFIILYLIGYRRMEILRNRTMTV
jgi:hypothetical protein